MDVDNQKYVDLFNRIDKIVSEGLEALTKLMVARKELYDRLVAEQKTQPNDGEPNAEEPSHEKEQANEQRSADNRSQSTDAGTGTDSSGGPAE